MKNILVLTKTPWRRKLKVQHRIHKAHQRSLSWARWIHSTLPPPNNLPKDHFDPIPSTPWSFKWSFSFGLSHQNPVQVSPFSHARHVPRPPHSPWFDLPNNICDDYKLWCSPLCNLLHSPLTSSFLGPHILLITLFSNTLSLCSSPNVRDQVSHPNKITGRIMVLYILIFKFLDSRREDRRLWTEW
jgi:hypothetical protein